MEIEKKFRLPQLPPRNVIGQGAPIRQGYLFTKGGELRVRSKGDKCFLTVKGEGTLAREEWESEVPPWVFQILWPKTEGQRIEKVRHSIQEQGLILEVDEYLETLNGLVTLECEFPDPDSARGFTLPVWARGATDVTEDPLYKNKILATSGMPKPV